MAGRASIVGAAATHVGKVRDHNEDAHYIDVDLGLFLVCDGMGGHAAGEVASELAIASIRSAWDSAALRELADRWLERGTADDKKRLLNIVRAGAQSAHAAILDEAERDDTKSGMGTTLVGAVVIGGELVFAHAGDSRAYLVRDGISMQLTEDHTLLSRLLAAGIDVDVSGEGSRFRSMLTNALGIGEECKVSTFVVPLADGDRFLLCSDGISEYVPENEVGEVLTKQASPARAAQRLIDLALERGGGDNATAVVVRVLEAGETPLPAEQRRKDDEAIRVCPLWGHKITPQQRLRALRIAIPRDHNFGEKLPPHALGDRVAWIVLEGELVQDGVQLGPGALVYPEALIAKLKGETLPPPDRDAQAITRSDVRALAIRADDFHELCDDDTELGDSLLDTLHALISKRKLRSSTAVDALMATDPQVPTIKRADTEEGFRPTDPDLAASAARSRVPAADSGDAWDDESTEEQDASGESTQIYDRSGTPESSIIAPVKPRAQSPQLPVRPSPPHPRMKSASTPPPPPPRRAKPSPPPLPPVRPSPSPVPARPSPPPQVKPELVTSSPARSGRTTAPPPISPPARAGRTTTPPPSSHVAASPALAMAAPSALVAPAAAAVVPLAAAPHAGSPARAARSTGPHVIAAPLAGSARARSASAPPPPPARTRTPTDPEIEAYFEIEADLPSETGGEDPDLESDLALNLAFSGDLEHTESVSTVEAGGVRVIETVTETDSHTLTVTITETVDDTVVDTVAERSGPRARTVTVQDGIAVSGSIAIDNGDAPRARRHSEPRDE